MLALNRAERDLEPGNHCLCKLPNISGNFFFGIYTRCVSLVPNVTSLNVKTVQSIAYNIDDPVVISLL